MTGRILGHRREDRTGLRQEHHLDPCICTCRHTGWCTLNHAGAHGTCSRCASSLVWEGWVSASMQNDDGKGGSDRQYVPSLMHDSLRTAIRRDCGPTRTTTESRGGQKEGLARRSGGACGSPWNRKASPIEHSMGGDLRMKRERRSKHDRVPSRHLMAGDTTEHGSSGASGSRRTAEMKCSWPVKLKKPSRAVGSC
jgi:hypothetical protein